MEVKSILAFDLDGTLTKRNTYIILPAGLTAILNALNEKGHVSVLVTGKPATYASRVIETNNLIDRGVIAENAGVYRKPGSNTISIYEESTVSAILALRKFLGIGEPGGGVRTITLKGKQHQMPVDPEDISILTFFTDPAPISHRWKFNQSISTDQMYSELRQEIIKNNWSDDLEILPPFPDGGIQIIRKSRTTGKIIDKSLLPEVAALLYDVQSLPPTAMFGDGHNDIPAMTPESITPLTFSNAHPEVIKFVQHKGGFVSRFEAPEGLGVVEGLYWLANRNFFQSDAGFVKELLLKSFNDILR